MVKTLGSVEGAVMEDERVVPSFSDALNKMTRLRAANPRMPISHLLPLIFRLKGKPYTINDGHFLFEHEYCTHDIPRRQIDKAGRQVAKSTNKASGGILRAASVPHYNMLTVTPLFEQVRKFSNNYVKPFLMESTVRTRLMQSGADQQVLQRTLGNGSNMFYNYASNSADRIRGTPADEVDCDEIQDFDLDVLPVIQSCLDASLYKIERYSGTPKTYDNALQVYWEQSSMGIWHIECQATGCKHVNVCCVEGDLLGMIGDLTRRKDGSIRTLQCSKCGAALDSRLGYFVHTHPERRLTFAGYHMPQIVFPMHYASALAWDKILDTMLNKPKHIFFNESLGESYDTGQKLITLKDLKEAGRGKYIKPSEVDKRSYVMTALGVDWGGKGKERTTDSDEFVSNTALAHAGIRADGKIEVTWGYVTPYIADHFQEANIVKDAAALAGVEWVAHDFGGAGNVREAILIQSGWPRAKICPFTYMSAAPDKPIVNYSAPPEDGVRDYWSLDKARSLLLLCELIRAGYIIFPPYDGPMKHMLNDFLNIFEEMKDNPRGRTMSLVHRVVKQHDDFVHAVNYACMALYHATGFWPDVADAWLKMDPRTMTASDGTTEATSERRIWLPEDVR